MTRWKWIVREIRSSNKMLVLGDKDKDKIIHLNSNKNWLDSWNSHNNKYKDNRSLKER